MSSSEQSADRSLAENCARLKQLGYITGKHLDLYGEHVELISDPYVEGDCVVVCAFSENNPVPRTIELPVSIISGWEDLFKEAADPADSTFRAHT